MNKQLLMITATSLALSSAVFAQPVPLAIENSNSITESLPDHLIYMYSAKGSGPQDAGSQLSTTAKRWPPASTLKVCFFGGNPVVKTLIASMAVEWNAYSSVKLDMGANGIWRNCADPAAGFNQVRVGFGERGYWSTIGTDSNSLLNINQPSMNFERFDTRYSPYNATQSGERYSVDRILSQADPYDRGTILHEFGHALGLLHEHQNPKLNCYDEIRWKEPPTVYDYYGKPPNSWDPQKVDFNIGSIGLSQPDIVAGKADPKSVMMYAQPAAIFKKGALSKCFVAPNNELSVLDKQYIASIYPAGAKPLSDSQYAASTLPAVSPAVAASLGGRNDILERVNTDLLSEVTSVRREARQQLAALLQASQSTELASNLTRAAVGKSYRHQLGVATALSHTNLPFKSSPEEAASTLAALREIAARNKSSTNDSSLSEALQQAITAVQRR